jgi:oligoribonuclease (3'-5' exoribonuclease)
MKRKDYWIFDTDIETNGFNGPMMIDGDWVLGEQYHAILQLSGKLIHVVDSELEVVEVFDYWIRDEKRIGNWNESTREFHDKIHEGASESFNDQWAKQHHYSLEEVQMNLLEMFDRYGFTKKYDPRDDQHLVISGRSVGFDKSFINAQLPVVGERLSHQVYDVSTYRVGFRMFHDEIFDIQPGYPTHNALEDAEYVHQEIEQLRIFIQDQPSDGRYLRDANKMNITWRDIFGSILSKLLGI